MACAHGMACSCRWKRWLDQNPVAGCEFPNCPNQGREITVLLKGGTQDKFRVCPSHHQEMAAWAAKR